jgi:hypothetical protein
MAFPPFADEGFARAELCVITCFSTLRGGADAVDAYAVAEPHR